MGRSAGRAGGGGQEERRNHGGRAGGRAPGAPQPPARGVGDPRQAGCGGPSHRAPPAPGLAQGRGQRRARGCEGPPPDTPHSCRVVHGRGASRPGRPRSAPDAGQRGLGAHRGALELGRFAQQPFSKAPLTPARGGAPFEAPPRPLPARAGAGPNPRGACTGAPPPRAPRPPRIPAARGRARVTHLPPGDKHLAAPGRRPRATRISGPSPPRAPPAVGFLLGARSPQPPGPARVAGTSRPRPRPTRSTDPAGPAARPRWPLVRGCAGLGPPPGRKCPRRSAEPAGTGPGASPPQPQAPRGGAFLGPSWPRECPVAGEAEPPAWGEEVTHPLSHRL